MTTPKFFVYILATENCKVIYIGVTNELKRRVFEHRSSIIKGFTYHYNIHKLVHYESFGYIEDAILREKRLKRWKREWKNDLINTTNPKWLDLSPTL
jgi:putative endonuclease